MYGFGTASKIQFWGQPASQAARPARHPASRPARQAASQPRSQAASQPGHPDSQRGSQASQASQAASQASQARPKGSRSRRSPKVQSVYREHIRNCMGLGQPPKFSSGASQPGSQASQAPSQAPSQRDFFKDVPRESPGYSPTRAAPRPASEAQRQTKRCGRLRRNGRLCKSHGNPVGEPRATFLRTSHAKPPVMTQAKTPTSPTTVV